MLSQDETPLLYSIVFGEGVVNDATSVVLFHAIHKFDLSHGSSRIALQFMGNFLLLFSASTSLGIVVGTSESLWCCFFIILSATFICDLIYCIELYYENLYLIHKRARSL